MMRHELSPMSIQREILSFDGTKKKKKKKKEKEKGKNNREVGMTYSPKKDQG